MFITLIVLICSKQNEQLRKRREEEKSKMQKELKKKQELEKAKLEEEKRKVCSLVNFRVVFKLCIYF